MTNDKNTYNEAKRVMENVLNTENGSREEKIAMNELESAGFEIFYSSLVEGFIYESKDIYDAFTYYISVGNVERVEKTATILNTYYTNYIKERFDELVENEEYEECAKIQKYL